MIKKLDSSIGRTILRWGSPTVVSACILSSCLSAARLATDYADMLYDYIPPFAGAYELLCFIRWEWILPIGLIATTLLLWKTKVLSAEASLRIDCLAAVASFIAIGLFLWMLRSFRHPPQIISG